MVRMVARGSWAHAAAVGLLAGLLGVACSGEPDARASPSRARNLLIICLDTVRFDAMRAAGFVEEGAPRRTWSERAVRLGFAHAPAPWTVPSVASVLTGRDPLGHGAGVFSRPVANLDDEVPSPIAPGVPTLAERLTAEGFETRAYVAHPWFESGYGLERGFSHLELEEGRRRLAGKATVWLNWHTAEKDPKPFFLYLHFMESHANLTWKKGMYKSRGMRLTPVTQEAARAHAPAGACDDPGSSACWHYVAYVQSVAEQLNSIARVLTTLEETGLLEQTLVMLYSDHGEEFRDHEAAGRARGVDPRGIYGLGHGQSLYEELLHVPVWIWHPSAAGRREEAPVSLLDLMPTALDWLGLDGGKELDGQSLLPWLLRGAPAPAVDRPLFATRIAYGPEQAAILRGGWKLVSYGQGAGALFNLVRDPGEHQPVQGAPVLDVLASQLAEWTARAPVGTAPPPSLSREQLERLESLGYLGGVPAREPEPAPQPTGSD